MINLYQQKKYQPEDILIENIAEDYISESSNTESVLKLNTLENASDLEVNHLTKLADKVISVFEKVEEYSGQGKTTANPLIVTVASWYENIRNAMEFRQEEVVLRSAIQRILKRRILLRGSGKSIAKPLIRELVWARYFIEDDLPDNVEVEVIRQIDIYLLFKQKIFSQKILSVRVINEWIIHLMSSSIERLLNTNKEKEVMNNLVFQILKNNIIITDDSEQTRDAQVFIAVRKSFAKDDVAFLRYHLFTQFFGDLTMNNIELASRDFLKVYKEIYKQLNYKRKDAIFNYVKRKTGAFFILEDIFHIGRYHVRDIIKNSDELQKTVLAACQARYKGIASKVRRAFIRSVLFIIFTKSFFAFAVEGTFESMVYGHVVWNSIFLNASLPPLIMIFVGLFIRIPRKDNSLRILNHIKIILFNENPILGQALIISKREKNINPLLSIAFSSLWFLGFFVSFGILIFILFKLHFNLISQCIFLFFSTIVSFLCYRISLMASVYSVDPKPRLLTPIFDFFFMPIIRVGRNFTEGISQINILLFVFDFIIETPFKGLFSFFEQWFLYLQSKREGLE
ncbi:hypothetical protein LBMAG33_4820 [Candidatus Levyibacteriota bacterium]|nr:hypothetical protein LBMAG33_4820 [Candidatus Levybacteria bacterium]